MNNRCFRQEINDRFPVKLNLAMVMRRKSSLYFTMLLDLLNVSIASKFKCCLRALMKLLYKDKKGCVV